MKIFNLILATLFFLFAGVQLNDPDPWAWVALYTYVAIISSLAAWGRYRPELILIGLVICLGTAAGYLPDFLQWIKDGMPSITGSMKAESLYIELIREFFGVVLAALCLGFHWYQYQKTKNLTNP